MPLIFVLKGGKDQCDITEKRHGSSNLARAKKGAPKGCRLYDTNFFSSSSDHKSHKGGVGMRLLRHLHGRRSDEERVVE